MITGITFAYYLFTIIEHKDLTVIEFRFGVAYLIFFSIIPIVRGTYKIIRDRND
jgi:hypothetical protein